MRRFRPPVGWSVLLLLAGCAGGETDTSHEFSLVTEDGLKIARNTGGPLYGEELFDYEPVLTLREDEREESLLWNPADLSMDEAGHIYVSDTGNRRVAVFDASGRYSHSLGGPGRGPGEFEAARIEEITDGVLTAFDLAQTRLSLFNTSGTLIRDIRLPTGVIGFGLTKCAALPDDTVLLMGFVVDMSSGMGAQDMAASVAAVDAAGDTSWSAQCPPVHVIDRIMVSMQGTSMPMPVPVPFAPYPWVTYHHDHGIFVSAGAGPVIDVYSPRGVHLRLIDVGLQPEMATDEELDSLKRQIQTQMDEANEALKPMFAAQLENQPTRVVKAHWREVEVDDSGYLWLKLPTGGVVPTPADSVSTYRVISPEGEYLGLTTRPKGTYYGLAHGHLLANYLDPETDEPTITVYRIRSRIEGMVYP